MAVTETLIRGGTPSAAGNVAFAPARKGSRFWWGVLVGALVSFVLCVALTRFASSAAAGGPVPVAVSYPKSVDYMDERGEHIYVDLTNRGDKELVVAPSLFVAKEGLAGGRKVG